MSKHQDRMEFAKLMLNTISAEHVAEHAAQGKAECDIYIAKIHDSVMPEITIGHAAVVIAVGSEKSIEKVREALIALHLEGE